MANQSPTPKPENLTPFPPGTSGNAKGSSAKQRLTTALLKLIEEKGLDDPFVQVGMKAALKGDFKFWAYIFDRVDGKISDKLEVKDRTLTVDRRDRKPKGKPAEPPPESGEGEG